MLHDSVQVGELFGQSDVVCNTRLRIYRFCTKTLDYCCRLNYFRAFLHQKRQCLILHLVGCWLCLICRHLRTILNFNDSCVFSHH